MTLLNSHVIHLRCHVALVLLEEVADPHGILRLFGDVEMLVRLRVRKRLVGIMWQCCRRGSLAMNGSLLPPLHAGPLVHSLPLQTFAQARPDNTKSPLVRGELTMKVVLVGATIQLLEEPVTVLALLYESVM
jgi:hypothetical protein